MRNFAPAATSCPVGAVFNVLITLMLLFGGSAHGQVLSVGGGETFGVATRHDYVTVELNLPWKEKIWERGLWSLDLNQAISVSRFHDLNTVYLVSWAPNVLLRWRNRDDLYPYLRIGFGVALMSDDNFQSEDNDPRHTGTTDMGTHGQFESSIALGVVHGRFGVQARAYHYSNANVSSTNDGIDVAELAISYRF